VIEPRLSLQWWVKVSPLAKAAGDAVRDGRVRIHPKDMEGRWFAWVDNMHDWCISRQLWWGHRIPVWYGPAGEVICLGPDEDVPTGYGWRPDEDVLDTWFSSGLWPFSTLGWPDETAAREKFYPNKVLVTGYDILFFWVARMMMFGLYAHRDKPAEQAVPFRVVALHGLVRDQFGRKMTKSAGNAVDPIVWLDKYGADAVRFTMAHGANPGTDVPVGEDSVQESRNFCNKLWNATRFALLHGARVGSLPPSAELSAPDRWILSRLNTTVAAVDALYEDFQFSKVCEALYHFTWDEFCDWYVELAKTPLAAGGAAPERTQLVLGQVLDTLLRLLHPVIPFVTEQLWTTLTGEESLVIASWPTADESRFDGAAEAAISEIQRLVTEVRRFRADQGLKARRRVMAQLTGHAGGPAEAYETEIRSLTWLDAPSDSFSPTASLQALRI
jgi:valyl-tRNA synthetase